ncbi:MAG: VanZ family protein [Lachnospiraceae bacterium]|nr:VanZ family protein [Lachnospiraceae bacterium]
MMTWLSSILDGSKIFCMCVAPIYVMTTLILTIVTKRWNPAKVLILGVFLYYLCCVFALVFLPLPSLEEAMELTYHAELCPLHCICDIAKDPLRGTLVVIFNFVMTIPFGMFLRYYFGLDAKKVFLYSLALTTLIEFGQFSGFFFLFRGSYRLFEIDDLILNTAGGMIGYVLMKRFELRLWDLQSLEVAFGRKGLIAYCGKRRVVV